MELEEIDVFIEHDGQVRIEVRGVKGGHCLTVTKDLEQALGGQVVQREMTPEANEPGPQQSQDRQWQQGN